LLSYAYRVSWRVRARPALHRLLGRALAPPPWRRFTPDGFGSPALRHDPETSRLWLGAIPAWTPDWSIGTGIW